MSEKFKTGRKNPLGSEIADFEAETKRAKAGRLYGACKPKTTKLQLGKTAVRCPPVTKSPRKGCRKSRNCSPKAVFAASFKPEMGSGDTGFTDLFGGKRVRKTDLRIKTAALIDELSSLLGVVKTGLRAGKDKQEITAIQRSMIGVSGLIAGAGTSGQVKGSIAAVEALIACRSKRLPPIKKFILPGKNKTEALIHVSRSRARLCEILAWQLKTKLPAIYLNRLSDYLFLLAAKK